MFHPPFPARTVLPGVPWTLGGSDPQLPLVPGEKEPWVLPACPREGMLRLSSISCLLTLGKGCGEHPASPACSHPASPACSPSGRDAASIQHLPAGPHRSSSASPAQESAGSRLPAGCSCRSQRFASFWEARDYKPALQQRDGVRLTERHKAFRWESLL